MATVLLLSGGLDSICLAYWRRPAFAVTVNYGQRCFPGELRASQQVAAELGIPHEAVQCDLASFGSGDMSQAPAAGCAPVAEWWPFRNQLLITVAAMAAIKHNLDEVIIGCVRSDKRHIDGTSAFIDSMCTLTSEQEGSVTVSAPAINMSTSELVVQAALPNSLLRTAFSCHRAPYACGVCAGCRKTISTIEELRRVAT